MIQRARDLSLVMVNNIVNHSRKFNRAICTQYDNIVRRVTAQSEKTEELVKQIDYVENLRVGELLELRVPTVSNEKDIDFSLIKIIFSLL